VRSHRAAPTSAFFNEIRQQRTCIITTNRIISGELSK